MGDGVEVRDKGKERGNKMRRVWKYRAKMASKELEEPWGRSGQMRAK